MKSKHYLLALAALSIYLAGCKKDNTLNPSNSKSVIAADPLVLTPAGWLPKSHVHPVENGYSLMVQNGHVLKIEMATNKLIEDLGEIKPLSIIDPSVKQKNLMLNNANNVAPTAVNWQAYTEWDNTSGSALNYFSTNWNVPTTPTNTTDGQTIFLFNGFSQTELNGDIVQPVLQWGSSAAGGGKYWSIANWYVWPSGGNVYAAFSTPITVTSGTNLQGIINHSSRRGDGSFDYTSSFNGYSNSLQVIENDTYSGYLNPGQTGGHTSTVTIPYINQEYWAFETLECYNSSNYHNGYGPLQASDYPAEPYVALSNINLQTGGVSAPLNWTAETGSNTYFGEHMHITNNNSDGTGQVEIYYHPAGPYTFGVETTFGSATYFYIIVNSENISGSRGTAPQNQVNNVTNTNVTTEPNSTVVFQVTSGHVPTSAYMNGPFGTVYGTISGNNITFSNVNLSIGNSCGLFIN